MKQIAICISFDVYNFEFVTVMFMFEVTVDADGVVSYSVTAASFTEAQAIRDAAEATDFATQVTDDLSAAESEITVNSVTTSNEIEAVISATIDTTDATGTVDANDAVTNLAETYGFSEGSQEGKFH